MKIFIVLAGLICCTRAFMFGPNREELNQNATLLCIREGDLCILEVRITSLDNPAGVYYENPDDNLVNTIGSEGTVSASPSTTITGTGTVEDAYILRIVIPCTGEGAAIVITLPAPNPTLSVLTGTVVKVVIMVKHLYAAPLFEKAVYVEDVRYQPECDFATVAPQTVTSGMVPIIGGSDETITAESDTAVLGAFNSVGLPALLVFLGEDIYWGASIADPTNSNAVGLYLYSCDLCDSVDCSNVAIPIIGPDGCTLVAGNYITGFTDATSSGLTITNTFSSFKLSASNNLYLRCGVNFCYTLADQRCVDFCAFNTVARKKRATDKKEKKQLIMGRVRISVSGNTTEVEVGPQSPVEKEPDTTQSMGLMAAVIALSALLVIGLIVAVFVFVRLTARNNQTPQKA